MTDLNALLSPKTVASMFGVTPKTITRWAKDGKLPVVYTPGGHRRFPQKEVLEILDKSRCASCRALTRNL